MTTDDDFELVRRFNAAGRTTGLSDLEDILAPDFVAHNGDDDVHGADGWRAFVAAGEAQWGPSDAGIDELIGNGSFVAERWWMRTTGPTEVKAHGVTMHRIVDGRIA